MKKYVGKKYITSLVIFASFSLFATEEKEIDQSKGHIHGTHKECSLPRSSADIIECALRFHPSIRRGALSKNSASKLIERAAQMPNPTFSSRYVRGDDSGSEVSELEANLSFTFELGGKRSSRKEYAVAKKDEIDAISLGVSAQIKLETVLNLYRLRQIFHEEKLLDQSLLAFNRVIGQLKKRSRLSAQQTATLTLFEVSLETAKVDKAELFEQERIIEHFFHVSTGHSLKEIYPFLPKIKTIWPKISPNNQRVISPALARLKSVETLALKELEIEESLAWPDLKIGPSLSIMKDGEVENKLVGFNIQIPLPLFQVNGGAKAFARSELIRAKKNVDFTRLEENHERFEQFRIYESAREILSKTLKPKIIANKHNKIEQLYLRGVVSSSVFLESLRQNLNYLKSRNIREYKAVKALWSIYKYDGKILKEKI